MDRVLMMETDGIRKSLADSDALALFDRFKSGNRFLVEGNDRTREVTILDWETGEILCECLLAKTLADDVRETGDRSANGLATLTPDEVKDYELPERLLDSLSARYPGVPDGCRFLDKAHDRTPLGSIVETEFGRLRIVAYVQATGQRIGTFDF